MSVQPTDGIGVEFLDYRIEGLAGHGGMGVVYRAHDSRLKRTVALKLMTPALALDERFQDRFSRESELAMSLEHPNVVPIYDAGEVDGRLYLAMRYVDGTDLRRRLREEGMLSPRDAVAIVKQVAHALDAAHAKGLVHRDVKPSNVLLDASGHVYLADFGLTRRFAAEGFAFGDARSLGTPAYLAPEQIEGGPVDGRADVYSLGCMLYECLTGTAPFSRGSRLAMVWAHLEEEPPSASKHNAALPEAIDDVIRKALAKNPDDRYETCAELVAAAEEALGVSPAGTSSRGRLAFAVAAIFVVLAAIVGAVVARGDQNAGKSGKPGPVVRANTLVRIDPKTNEITAVVGVGKFPAATAVAGDTVWVYNLDSNTVSEVDAATNTARHTTPISSPPAYASDLPGNVLAADAAGVWIVGGGAGKDNLLTRILADGQGKREYRLTDVPSAVAVAQDAVWVVTNPEPPSRFSLRPYTPRSSYVLRVDPDTGTVTRRLPFSPTPPTHPTEGLVIANGAAWVMGGTDARLYRVDLGSGRSRWRDLGDGATPPVAAFGSLWICVATPGSSIVRIDPQTFRTTFTLNSIPAEDGHFAVGYGSLWRHDAPSGNLLRFNPDTGKVSGAIRVSPKPPIDGRGLIPTSVAAGAGSVWITVSRV